ncbi:MAG TPA: hypothetical protein VIG33_13735 [Pseudobdellovibrionaceae bacterium]|jgi:hypothetical protein
MKKALVMTLVLAISSISFAWIEKAPQAKSYEFKFKLKAESFVFSSSALSYDEAFEVAAKACFKHYKRGRHVSEDQGLDIIDVCANPRS